MVIIELCDFANTFLNGFSKVKKKFHWCVSKRNKPSFGSAKYTCACAMERCRRSISVRNFQKLSYSRMASIHKWTWYQLIQIFFPRTQILEKRYYRCYIERLLCSDDLGILFPVESPRLLTCWCVLWP
jgi:hypothetical protein